MTTTHLAAIAIDTLAAMEPAGAILKRTQPGAFVNGRWVDGAADAPLPIVATVHAMKDKERDNLPEGLRHDDMRVLHTREPLRIHTDDAVADVIEYKGRDYTVLRVRERFEGGFYRAVIGHNHVRTNSI